MAGLRTAVILEAIETLDRHGMPGGLLVQELSADLAKESAYNFADKLNKRVEVILKHTDDLTEEDDSEEEPEKPEAPKKSVTFEKQAPPKREAPRTKGSREPSKSVDDLLAEIV